MNIYRKKDYIKWHLRCEIKERYNNLQSYREICTDLWIKSTVTISRRVNAESIDSKSSAPNLPNRKYEELDLYYTKRIL